MPAEPPTRRAGRDVPPGLATTAAWTWRILLVGAGVVAIGWVFLRLSIITIPIFLALLVASVLWPVTDALRRRGAPPALAAAASFGLLVAVVVLVAVFVGPAVADQTSELETSIREGASDLPDALGGLGIERAEVEEAVDGAVDALRDNAREIGLGVFEAVLVAANIITGIFFGLVILFFFLKDGPLLWRSLLRLVPAANRETVDRAGHGSFRSMSAYVRGQALVALIDAVGIGLALVLVGVPLALPVAVLTFILAFIPFIGAFVSGLIAVLVALAFGGVTDALIILGAVIAVQQLEGNVLQPVIVGRAVSLHPVVVLAAVGAGGTLAGIAGAIVAVPLAAAIHGAARSLAGEPDPVTADAPPEPATAAGETGEREPPPGTSPSGQRPAPTGPAPRSAG